MEIIFDDDDLEPLIRDMPVAPVEGSESKTAKQQKSRKHAAALVPQREQSLFDEKDLTPEKASTDLDPDNPSKTDWQQADLVDGSFVKTVGMRLPAAAPIKIDDVSKTQKTSQQSTTEEAISKQGLEKLRAEVDPFEELLEKEAKGKRRRLGRKDTSRPGSESPHMISSAADVLSFFGKNKIAEKKDAKAKGAQKACNANGEDADEVRDSSEDDFELEVRYAEPWEEIEEVGSAEISFEIGDSRKRKQTDKKHPKQRPSLMQRAIASLARREHSRLELKRKLARTLEDGETIAALEEVLDVLEKRGLLSDERYASIKARSVAARMGDAKIRRELRIRGVDENTAREAVKSINETEEVRAYKMWRRRFEETPKTWKEREKQIRYLAYRGFSLSSIMKVLRGEVQLSEDGETFHFS